MKPIYLLLILLIVSCSKEDVVIPDQFADCREQVGTYDISQADANGLIEGDIIPDMQVKG